MTTFRRKATEQEVKGCRTEGQGRGPGDCRARKRRPGSTGARRGEPGREVTCAAARLKPAGRSARPSKEKRPGVGDSQHDHHYQDVFNHEGHKGTRARSQNCFVFFVAFVVDRVFVLFGAVGLHRTSLKRRTRAVPTSIPSARSSSRFN